MAFDNFYEIHHFSVNHPERREDERWWMNDAVPDNYTEPRFKTLRVGHDAYDAEGLLIPGLVPLFLSEEEFTEATRYGASHEDFPIEDDLL